MNMVSKKDKKELTEEERLDNEWKYFFAGIIIVELTVLAGIVLAVMMA